MSMRFLVAVVLATFFMGVQFKAVAATFVTDDLGVSITMSGEIKSGDADRFASIFVAVKPIYANYFPFPNSLYLDSPGGDVAEAIRIAELVKVLALSVATMPDGKGVCASSCFLIYAAALERSAAGIDTLKTERVKGNLGPLGIHRPYLRQHADGPLGVKRQEQIMSDMRAYLVNASVGHALIDKMMAHASNDIYWLNAEEVRALGSYAPGVEEQLISKCGYDARREANLTAREFIKSSKSGVLNCVADYKIKTFEPLKYAAIDRMRKGWRPWK